MLIDTPGKYDMLNGDQATIFRVDRTTSLGNIPAIPDPMVWSNEGDPVGHDLRNRIVGKHANIPNLAIQIIRLLQQLPRDDQREDVMCIVHQQFCKHCWRPIEPGEKCQCWNDQ